MRYISILFFTLFVLKASATTFHIATTKSTALIIVDSADCRGVMRAASDLGEDVKRVCGREAAVSCKMTKAKGNIIVGTVGHSRWIDDLVKSKKLDVHAVRGQWESYLIDIIDGNLVIAGSDRRGTIYGIYEISKEIGVSPWYWWADVPVRHESKIDYSRGRQLQPSPKVKYRGIFINDEWPSFGGWAQKHFGGLNHKMYGHLFELLLRLKANYLWPAMWATAFNEDDSLNPKLADEYGIVMGTSHHEPMMRAYKEYTDRRKEIGPWDYSINKPRLDKFFHEGLERNKAYDNLVTIGMRGDGDVAMGKGDDEENMKTLHSVIGGQRQIIKDVYGRADSVPQLWAIFTEVQRYYDAGFTVPDDVTLLFCDNNWGYIRRTGPEKERQRKGGMGLYYHIDMNGGPWNDRWINTSPLPKLRNQLELAYKTGLDRIWIINVGDLKPKEVPINFIMDYAWDPDKIKAGDEQTWLIDFAAQCFPREDNTKIADIMRRYVKYNAWRKPEVETTDYFSVENNHEAARLLSLWKKLEKDVRTVKSTVKTNDRDAFYQLVEYPAMASSGVARLYLYAGLHNYYAKRGIATAYADSARMMFGRDSVLTAYYNDSIASGKWQGMMQDKHIGYTKWYMPDNNTMPQLLPIAEKKIFATVADCPQRTAKEYSIEASDFSRNVGDGWMFLPDLGRSKGCMGAKDVLKPCEGSIGKAPYLEYQVTVTDTDTLQVAIGILPTQDVKPKRGLRLAVSVNDARPVMLDARRGLVDTFGEYTLQNLKRSKVLRPLPPLNRSLYLCAAGKPMRNEVFDDIRWLNTKFAVNPLVRRHIIRVYLIDPEIVLEKIIVNPDNNAPSYFGK